MYHAESPRIFGGEFPNAVMYVPLRRTQGSLV